MTRRLAVAALVLLAVLAAGVGRSDAVDFGIGLPEACPKEAPDPQTPDGGMDSTFVRAPENPLTADPFAEGAQVSVYDVYGFGGLRWSTYDQSCVDNWAASTPNMAANTIADFPMYLLGATDSIVETMRTPSFLGVFDPLIDNAAGQVRHGVFRAIVPLTLIAAALFMVAQLRHGSLSGLLRALGWVLFVFTLATMFLVRPTGSVHLADQILMSFTTVIDQSFGGSQSQLGQVHRQVLYETWAGGTFGDAQSETARRFGPDLFKASAYSWAEMARIREDPESAEGIKEAKKEAFTETAERVKEADPLAYEHLQGKHSGNRIWRAVFGLLGTLGATLYQLIAGVASLFAFIAIRIFVLAWPVTALLAMFPTQRTLALRLWSYAAGAAVASIGLLFVARLVSVFTGAVLGAPGLPGWLTVLLLFVVFAAAWKLTRAHRSFAGGRIDRVVRWGSKQVWDHHRHKKSVQDGVTAAGDEAREAEGATGPLPPPPGGGGSVGVRPGWVAPGRVAVGAGHHAPDYGAQGLQAGRVRVIEAGPPVERPGVIELGPVPDHRGVFVPVARGESSRPTVD